MKALLRLYEAGGAAGGGGGGVSGIFSGHGRHQLRGGGDIHYIMCFLFIVFIVLYFLLLYFYYILGVVYIYIC